MNIAYGFIKFKPKNTAKDKAKCECQLKLSLDKLIHCNFVN